MTELFKEWYQVIEVFFIVYLIGYSTFLFFSVTVGSLSLYEQRKRKARYNYIDHSHYVPISIIVPAYNESVTVIDTVKSLLNTDYQLYEIIVVDDGSQDDTAECLIKYFEMNSLKRPIRKSIPCEEEQEIYVTYKQKVPITLVKKANGGKADALNMGINVSEYPYFICMDADSVLQGDALKNIVRPILEENNVVACGGLVRIVNDIIIEDGKVINYRMPKKILVCMQILEYDRTFLASRLLFDKFNGNLIISGAFGLFKKDLVIAVGGYDSQTMGEDMELVVRLHAFCRSNKIPYRIKYAADAVCWSQAPESLRDLKKQRRRWHIGLFQSITTHRQLLFNPEYGLLSFISFLYFLVYELLSPYIEIFGIVTILVAMSMNLVNIPYMIVFFIIYALFNSLMSLTAFFARVHAMNQKLQIGDVLKAVGLCVIENVVLRLIITITRITAFRGYRKKKMNWGSITRVEMKKSLN